MKPKLLVVELWGLGDLMIATPFLQAASERFVLTLLAKPYARDLQVRFWPQVKVVPFIAPWTAFEHKYRLFRWPWGEIFGLHKLRHERFEFGLSARWDPRDHLVLSLLRARQRLGFPRLHSEIFLNQPLERPDPRAHRYEYWRVIAHSLGFELPQREDLPFPEARPEGEILVHTGAGQAASVWPLDRFRQLVNRLRASHHRVQVACDPDQTNWWRGAGEKQVVTPKTVLELLALVDRAGAFIGNDSGPGHVAAFCGVPSFILFGSGLPEWFSPLPVSSYCLEGKPCPYKPCFDYCRFSVPQCLWNVTLDEVWAEVQSFLKSRAPVAKARNSIHHPQHAELENAMVAATAGALTKPL